MATDDKVAPESSERLPVYTFSQNGYTDAGPTANQTKQPTSQKSSVEHSSFGTGLPCSGATCQRPAGDHGCSKDASYDEPLLASSRRPGLQSRPKSAVCRNTSRQMLANEGSSYDTSFRFLPSSGSGRGPGSRWGKTLVSVAVLFEYFGCDGPQRH